MVVVPSQPHPIKGEAVDSFAFPQQSYAPVQRPRPARPRAHPQKQSDKPIEQEEHYVALVWDRFGQLHFRSSVALKRVKKSILAPSVHKFRDAVNNGASFTQHLAREGTSGMESLPPPGDSLTASEASSAGSISHPWLRPQKRARADTDTNSITPRAVRATSSPVLELMPDSAGRTIDLALGDTLMLEKWFIEAFERIQQVTCRLIAKLWIKKIQPKKQSMNPYNGNFPKDLPRDSQRTRPPYWPVEVPHREPDHIQKEQRVALLTHLIMHTPYVQVVPKKQHADEVGAADLRAQTEERKNDIAPDRWEVLQDIFRLRKLMERYEDGQLDAATIVTVLDCSKIARKEQGETEEQIADVDADSAVVWDVPQDEDDEAEPPMLTPGSSALPSPTNQHRAQGLRTARNSTTSSFSLDTHETAGHALPVGQQAGLYEKSLEQSFPGEVVPQSHTNSTPVCPHIFTQPVYNPVTLSDDQYHRALCVAVEHHEQQQHQHHQQQQQQQQQHQQQWSGYHGGEPFNQVSNVAAPLQGELMMSEGDQLGFGTHVYRGSRLGSMTTMAHGLPCSDEMFPQQTRIDQHIQRQLHPDLAADIASGAQRELVFRTSAAQQAALAGHHAYDSRMMQAPFYHNP